jgi:uncharacterized protein
VISDKCILITGGSSGIGKHLAMELLKRGNKVLIAAHGLDRLNGTESELKSVSQSVFSCHVDVSDSGSVRKMAESILRDHGCPDILVNCAGFATYRTFEESPIEEIEQLVSVNLLGAMRCTHYFLPKMIARKSGTIVNIASIAGKLVMTPNGIYSASKHGLVAWSEALKYELSRYNIDVSVICPGRVETSFFDHETFQTREPRKETRLTVPIEKVSQKIISAIENKRFLTFVPSYYGLIVWLMNACPFIIKPAYAKLIMGRINDIYIHK